MTGATNGGFYGPPWSFLISVGLVYAGLFAMIIAKRLWPQRWRRLDDILNRSMDSKRKDNNWGRWMP